MKKTKNNFKLTDVLKMALFHAHGLYPEYEVQFAPPRKWRFDYCFQTQKLAIEVQGGLFVQGRHVRGAALLKEHEKLNEAAIRGYRIIYCQPKDFETGAVFELVKRALA